MDMKTLIAGGIIIMTALVVFIVLFIFLYQKRYYRHLREKEQLKVQFSQELLHAQLEIQEQTLKNIAQEIHDNIGQELSLAKLNLNTMDINKQSELITKINTSKDLVSKAIQDLRDLSRSMNTDSIAAMGLPKAIGYELDMIRRSEVCHTSLAIHGNIVRLNEQKELILFRIVQESLHNIIKHAEAKNIDVSIIYSDLTLQLSIIDDGKGFEISDADKKDSDLGMGLHNMQNRAKLIGAEFMVSSRKNTGTQVRLVLPLNNKT